MTQRLDTPWYSGWRPSAALAACLVAIAGCGSPEAQFTPNLTYVKSLKLVDSASEVRTQPVQNHLQDVSDALLALFGTPDDPHLPTLPDVDISAVIDPTQLEISAGPVGRDERGRVRGLYREHCAHCHGINGDGLGPTAAFLNPYPRDYRRGIFKFKSTPSTTPPSHMDLMRILDYGIPGTAMPSFRLLPESELRSLAYYVKYLAIRGEVERALLFEIANELDEGDRLIDLKLKSSNPDRFQEQLETIKLIAAEVVQKWVDAESASTAIPAPPANWDTAESQARGKELFFTSLTNCSKCHGDAALGDGQTNDYDEWTKELEPVNPDAVAHYLALGALEPRFARPRNLRQGIYRGGPRPIDLFWRVKNGIAGTPMPSAAAQLTDDDLWHLIAYVRSLPYDSISEPQRNDPLYQRERN